MISKILEKARKGITLNKRDALTLLEVDQASPLFYELIATANELTRKTYHNQGYVFAQIGLNAEPCSKNCKFCSLGSTHYAVDCEWKKSEEAIQQEIQQFVESGVHDIFLMITADYDLEAFLDIVSQARQLIPEHIRLVVNMGDFDNDIGRRLKKIGVTGVYHIHRLREGIDTDILPEVRIATLDAIKEVGLELYYCVEPIGPEHTYDEIADEMIRARDYGVSVMAVMRRVPIAGTPLYDKGQITSLELTKIAAVARLVSEPTRAMNAHEVTPMSLIAGVNQLYGEYGANPRDIHTHTEEGRGYSINQIKVLLTDAEYQIS